MAWVSYVCVMAGSEKNGNALHAFVFVSLIIIHIIIIQHFCCNL